MTHFNGSRFRDLRSSLQQIESKLELRENMTNLFVYIWFCLPVSTETSCFQKNNMIFVKMKKRAERAFFTFLSPPSLQLLSPLSGFRKIRLYSERTALLSFSSVKFSDQMVLFIMFCSMFSPRSPKMWIFLFFLSFQSKVIRQKPIKPQPHTSHLIQQGLKHLIRLLYIFNSVHESRSSPFFSRNFTNIFGNLRASGFFSSVRCRASNFIQLFVSVRWGRWKIKNRFFRQFFPEKFLSNTRSCSNCSFIG